MPIYHGFLMAQASASKMICVDSISPGIIYAADESASNELSFNFMIGGGYAINCTVCVGLVPLVDI